MTTTKTPADLRSARWFAPDDLRSFGHRSRMMQLGYSEADFMGRPIIGTAEVISSVPGPRIAEWHDGRYTGANIVVAAEVQGPITLRLRDIPWRDALEATAKTLGFVVVEEDPSCETKRFFEA